MSLPPMVNTTSVGSETGAGKQSSIWLPSRSRSSIRAPHLEQSLHGEGTEPGLQVHRQHLAVVLLGRGWRGSSGDRVAQEHQPADLVDVLVVGALAVPRNVGAQRVVVAQDGAGSQIAEAALADGRVRVVGVGVLGRGVFGLTGEQQCDQQHVRILRPFALRLPGERRPSGCRGRRPRGPVPGLPRSARPATAGGAGLPPTPARPRLPGPEAGCLAPPQPCPRTAATSSTRPSASGRSRATSVGRIRTIWYSSAARTTHDWANPVSSAPMTTYRNAGMWSNMVP